MWVSKGVCALVVWYGVVGTWYGSNKGPFGRVCGALVWYKRPSQEGWDPHPGVVALGRKWVRSDT